MIQEPDSLSQLLTIDEELVVYLHTVFIDLPSYAFKLRVILSKQRHATIRIAVKLGKSLRWHPESLERQLGIIEVFNLIRFQLRQFS